MPKPDHTFSSFDGWVIDTVASLGLGLFMATLLTLVLNGIWGGGQDNPGAGQAWIALAVLSFVAWMVHLRRARRRRDSGPSGK